MRNLNPTYVGLATGLIMVAMSLGIYYTMHSFDNNLQYLTYAVYVAGVVYTIVHYSKMPHAIRSFRNYFSQGFKCFIVVTLVMVSFTYIFLKSDPGLREEMARNYRADLELKGNFTPAEIDSKVLSARDYFVIMLTSSAIFGYLVIGGLVTAVTSGILIKTKGRDLDPDHTSYTNTKLD